MLVESEHLNTQLSDLVEKVISLHLVVPLSHRYVTECIYVVTYHSVSCFK